MNVNEFLKEFDSEANDFGLLCEMALKEFNYCGFGSWNDLYVESENKQLRFLAMNVMYFKADCLHDWKKVFISSTSHNQMHLLAFNQIKARANLAECISIIKQEGVESVITKEIISWLNEYEDLTTMLLEYYPAHHCVENCNDLIVYGNANKSLIKRLFYHTNDVSKGAWYGYLNRTDSDLIKGLILEKING